MMKYFVSYTIRDREITATFLEAFAKELKKTGRVFIDIINNDSIDKQTRVISELESSDIMLLLETKNIYKSPWVTFEYIWANSKKIPIKVIPIDENSQSKSVSQLIKSVLELN